MALRKTVNWNKEKYTVEVHVKRLKIMLSDKWKEDIGCSCPAALYKKDKDLERWRNLPCQVCNAFIHLSVYTYISCPCILLGEHNAEERTKKYIKFYESNAKKIFKDS